MEHAKHIDPIRFIASEVGDSIMAIEQHANFSFFHRTVAITDIGKVSKNLRLVVNAVYTLAAASGFSCAM